MQLSNPLRLGGRSGVLVAVIACMALSGCGAMHQVSRFYDAAFPEQPVAIDDVVILDVMSRSATATERLDGNKILCRYKLEQGRQFTCRVDEESKTIQSAKIYDANLREVAKLDVKGKRTENLDSGEYVLEVISVVP